MEQHGLEHVKAAEKLCPGTGNWRPGQRPGKWWRALFRARSRKTRTVNVNSERLAEELRSAAEKLDQIVLGLSRLIRELSEPEDRSK